MDSAGPTSVVFPSKCDLWLKILLLGVVSVELSVAVFVFIGGNEIWVGFLMLGVAGFIVWFLRSTYYVVDETRLLIRSGPFWWTVQLSTVEEVAPTRNPLSSPALSMDRLCVCYRTGGKQRMVMISPADKEGFLQVIAALVPGMIIEGSRVRRKSPADASAA